MGLQSQMRGGAVKKCKEMGTNLKKKRKNAHIGLSAPPKRICTGPFVPELECKSCREEMRRKKSGMTSKYKKRHNKRCPRNSRTRGFALLTLRAQFNNFFAAREKNNNTLPVADHTKEESSEIKEGYFTPKGTHGLVHQPEDTSNEPTGTKFAPSNTSKTCEPTCGRSNTCISNVNPSEFRQELDILVENYKSDDGAHCAKKFRTSPFPLEVKLAAYKVSKDVEHRKNAKTSKESPDTEAHQQASDKCHRCFKPRTCVHTFLPENHTTSDLPSPHCHAIVGTSVMCLDWQLMAPEQTLHCHKCQCQGFQSELIHTRTNF